MSLLVAQFMETSRKQAFRSEAMNAMTSTGSNLRAVLSDNPNDAIFTLRDTANKITAYGLTNQNVFDINGDGCVVHDTGPPPVACPETVNNAIPLTAAALLANLTAYYSALAQAKAAGKPGLPVNLVKNSNPPTAGPDGLPGNILYNRTEATYGVSASGKLCGTYPSPGCPFQPDIYVTPDCAQTDFILPSNCDTPSWHYTILYKTSCLLAAKMGMAQVGSTPCPQPTSGFDLGTRTQEIYTGKQTYL